MSGGVQQPSICLFRSSAAIPFLDIFEEAGVPIQRYLENEKLPGNISREHDSFLPTKSVAAFVGKTARSDGIDDIGLRVVRSQSAPLTGKLWASIVGSHTLLEGLTHLCEGASKESYRVRIWLADHGDTVHLCHRASFPSTFPGQTEMTWWAVSLFEAVSRVFLDVDEAIPQIGVPRAREPGLLAREHFPNTRFVKATSEDIPSWPEIPRTRLHLPPRHHAAAMAAAESDVEPALDFVGSLAQTIEAYLPEGAPSINLAAEIVDMSVRTLQRRLADRSSSYSKVVERARFEIARRMLQDPGHQIYDVAFAAGYSDSPHFTRAFRRTAGVSPSEYRRLLAHDA